MVGTALMLLALAGCTMPYHGTGSELERSAPKAERTAQPQPTGQMSCCRWNRYVVNGGGATTALAVHPLYPNIVYATMDNAGLAKSTDYGNTWQTYNNNIGFYRLADIKLDPLDPDILYVTAGPVTGGGQGELYRSLDGGAHWEFLTDAFGAERWPSSREIVILSQDADGDRVSDVLYVGAWAGNDGGDKGGIWKSSDEGITWQQMGQIDGDGDRLKHANIWVLRSDPSDPDTLYAGLYVYWDSDTLGGLLKSVDGGTTWTDIGGDIPVSNISDIAISPDGRTIYAATNSFDYSEPGTGIFKSIDAGITWTPVNRGLEKTSLRFEVLLMDKDAPNVLYTGPFRGGGGIFKTTDGGESWQRTAFRGSGWLKNDPFGNIWALAQGADSRLYAASWKGIYRSDDDGETWHLRVQGLGNTVIFDIAVDPQNPSTIYMGMGDNGPWKSTDGGHTWQRINKGYYEPYGKRAGGAAAFAIAPSDPSIIYSAVRGSSGTTLSGVNKTTNGGRRWQAINNGLPGPDPAWVAADIVVHPQAPDTAYLGLRVDDGTGRVFKTVNGGEMWTEIASIDPPGTIPSVSSLALSTSAPDVVVVGTRNPGRVYKTIDAGASWSQISPPPHLMDPSTIIYDVDIHPLDPKQILLGVNRQGAYKTTDGGQTWIKILGPEFFEENIGNLALNPATKIHATIYAIQSDPDDPQIIYAGHNNRGQGGYGVARSTDGGASWALINDPGLQYRSIFTMDIHPQTKELFVGGFDGVYIFEPF